MTQAGFKPVIPASERPQTHSLDGAAKAIGHLGSRAAAKHFIEDMTTGRALNEIVTGSDDKCDVQNAVLDKLLFLDVHHKQPLTPEVPYCIVSQCFVGHS